MRRSRIDPSQGEAFIFYAEVALICVKAGSSSASILDSFHTFLSGTVRQELFLARTGIRDIGRDVDKSASLLLSQLGHIHEAKLAMCDRLEAIADALPSGVSHVECEAVARAIVPLLESAQRFEKEVVFPYCEELSVRCSPTFERLKTEHSEDMGYAEELTEVLLTVGEHRPVPGAETLGFMLRGFFGALRRHIAFEQEYVQMIVARDQG